MTKRRYMLINTGGSVREGVVSGADLLGCSECGCAVTDMSCHDRWHEALGGHLQNARNVLYAMANSLGAALPRTPELVSVFDVMVASDMECS